MIGDQGMRSVSGTPAAAIALAMAGLGSAHGIAAGQNCPPGDIFGAHTRFHGEQRPFDVALGDVDGDGDLDAVVSNEFSDDITVLLNSGSATFAPLAPVSVGDKPHRVALGDVDGNGSLDIAVTNAASNDVTVLLGNGDGTFERHLDLGVGDAPHGIVLEDVDGDNDVDIVVANRDSGDVSVLTNEGGSSFAAETRFQAGAGPTALSAADLDGDGDLDLVIANRFGDDVSVLLNDGGGAFTSDTEYEVGEQPQGVALGDLDGDGDTDMVVANADSDDASVLLNQGDAIFGKQDILRVGDRPLDVELADINQNGTLDAVVANAGPWGGSDDDDISVLLNEGDAQFGMENRFGVGNFPTGLSLGDMDGDGDIDALTSNRLSHDVSVSLNQCPTPPRIAAQPQSRVVDLSGPLQTFRVEAEDVQSYQWRLDGEPISNGPDFSGAESDTLTVAPGFETEGEFDVVVSNGTGSVTSEPAVLGVRQPCPADLTADGMLTSTDFLSFLDAFAAGCP